MTPMSVAAAPVPGRLPEESFVLPQHKVVYVSVTKAACTTMRWMIADLAGEDLKLFTRNDTAVQNQLMTIHKGRHRWKHALDLADLTPEELAQIRLDNGWFIFGVIRDPRSRFWSAWQSKFLVRHNNYVRDYADEPFFPRVAGRAEDVVEDFHRFVELRPWTTHPLLSEDIHFLPQTWALQTGSMPYSKVYDITEIPALTQDLGQHLRDLGVEHELYLPRANETPLALTREVLTEDVVRTVDEVFDADFQAFGDRWSLDRLPLSEGWTRDALAHAAYQAASNERINVLSRRAKAAARRRRSVNEELQRARHRIATLEEEVRAGRARVQALQRERDTSAMTRARRWGRRMARRIASPRVRRPAGGSGAH